jgi:hypothetical protein
MTINGTPEDPADHFDIVTQATFLAGGTGSVVFEDFGVPEDGSPFSLTWSASGGALTVDVEGEDPVVLSYTVSGDTLTLTFSENGDTAVFVYTRQ